MVLQCDRLDAVAVLVPSWEGDGGVSEAVMTVCGQWSSPTVPDWVAWAYRLGADLLGVIQSHASPLLYAVAIVAAVTALGLLLWSHRGTA